MTMNQYQAQTTVRMSVAFTASPGGGATDPTTVTATLQQPDTTTVVLTVVKDGVGNYHADFTPTQVGLHLYEWLGSGPPGVSVMGQFLVIGAPF